MLERGCSRPTERTTSLRVPWEILNTREEHEARALFRGMRAFRTRTPTTEAVQEGRWRRGRGSWRRSRGSRKQNAFKALNQRTRTWHSNSSGSSSRSTHLARKGGLSSGSSKRMIVQHWIAPSHSCREAAVVPPRATHCWIHTMWMTS